MSTTIHHYLYIQCLSHFRRSWTLVNKPFSTKQLDVDQKDCHGYQRARSRLFLLSKSPVDRQLSLVSERERCSRRHLSGRFEQSLKDEDPQPSRQVVETEQVKAEHR